MELSDAEMDVDSGEDICSNDMDIDSDLSLASPPPEAHDGSDCPVQGLSGLSGLSADRRMEEGSRHDRSFRWQ